MGKYYGEGGVYGGLGGYMTKWVAVWVFAIGGAAQVLFAIVAALMQNGDAAQLFVQGVVGLVFARIIKSIPTREPPRPEPEEEEPPTGRLR
jgi:hypothetical protein